MKIGLEARFAIVVGQEEGEARVPHHYDHYHRMDRFFGRRSRARGFWLRSTTTNQRRAAMVTIQRDFFFRILLLREAPGSSSSCKLQPSTIGCFATRTIPGGQPSALEGRGGMVCRNIEHRQTGSVAKDSLTAASVNQQARRSALGLSCFLQSSEP